MSDDQQYPNLEEFDFQKATLLKLYATNSGNINHVRWERVRQDIRFEDVVAETVGLSGGNAISCPFHGRDSTPSFWLYKGTNDGWCFGCPPGEQYYDHVRFVSKYLDVSRVTALKWIEKKFELPTLAEYEDVAEDEEETVTLELKDLTEPYIIKAVRDVQATQDVGLALEYLRFYFEAIHLDKAADELKKQGDDAEEVKDLQLKAAMVLARILGKTEIDKVLEKKARA